MSSSSSFTTLRDLLSQQQQEEEDGGDGDVDGDYERNPNAKGPPPPPPAFSSSIQVVSIVSVLSAHVGRILNNPSLRHRLRSLCLAPTANPSHAHSAISNLHMAVGTVDRLLASPNNHLRDLNARSLGNCIRLLSIVSDVDRRTTPTRRHRPSRTTYRRGGGGSTAGVSNAHLTACAHLYLSIAYKIQRKDRPSARHLLQVFHDSPYFARKNLLPDLWDHFFLPHLLHLKVWYAKEVEFISGWDVEFREQRTKFLDRVYNDQMDVGTSRFALYYIDWIKVDATEPPPVPSVSLPSSSATRSLCQALVFDSSLEREDFKFLKREAATKEGKHDLRSFIHSDFGIHEKRSLQDQQHPPSRAASVPRRSCSMRILSCSSSNKDSSSHARFPRSKSNSILPVIDLGRAISLISNSNRLDECETAIRVVAKSWLGSGGNSILETRLSTTSFIEGLLEVSWTSKDDEVLELAVSILAGLVTVSEVNQQVVLNASPQLEVFLRLLRHETLFSKAVVLLYLLKPKAKQMLSLDWMPLLLGILDNGNHAKAFFSVQCSPISAALYLIDQLLVGFNEDKNVENAREFVALGGLSRLINRLEVGDAREKQLCASLLATCVRADDSCRSFLAANINKASIIQLLVGNQLKSTGTAISLLSELVCLKRTTHMIEFLTGFKNDGCLNTMHVLMVYLQQAPAEQRPVAAAILLQLDLLGDPLQSSFYREEGIDAIIMALERSLHNKKIQEQCSKALFLLGGHIFTGEAEEEAWLHMRAGVDYSQEDVFNSTDKRANDFERMEEEVKADESWLRKLAFVLLTSGNKRFLVALSNCIADGSPRLARSCLITIAWTSWTLSSLYDANNILQSLVCSILAPRLLESLSNDKALEERMLASLSLLNFAKHPECLHKLLPVGKDTLAWLEDLARTTWTAKELLFLFQR